MANVTAAELAKMLTKDGVIYKGVKGCNRYATRCEYRMKSKGNSYSFYDIDIVLHHTRPNIGSSKNDYILVADVHTPFCTDKIMQARWSLLSKTAKQCVARQLNYSSYVPNGGTVQMINKDKSLVLVTKVIADLTHYGNKYDKMKDAVRNIIIRNCITSVGIDNLEGMVNTILHSSSNQDGLYILKTI